MRAAGPFPGDAAVAVAVAVAVSGGADSMTLLSLAHDWAAETGATLTALTVDHGLRPEAGAEAASQVGEVVSVQVIPRPHNDLSKLGSWIG